MFAVSKAENRGVWVKFDAFSVKILQYFFLPSYQIFRGKMLHKNAVIFALFHRYIIGLHEAVRKRCGWRLKPLVFLAGERWFGRDIVVLFALRTAARGAF